MELLSEAVIIPLPAYLSNVAIWKQNAPLRWISFDYKTKLDEELLNVLYNIP
ncbi:hypothetical protein [Sphingobacterium sp. LRF_L2]|uniref:hypothetical protein n=1 Tax=Sphingobacterium sp. LRF_L2 TaxID=3369421 RepID=UPI003F64217E